MTGDSVGPLSRPLPLHRVTAGGVTVDVEAGPEERAALAADLGLPAIHDLRGRFRIVGSPERVRVTGRVEAKVEQTCVVSLDGFETAVDEEVDVTFAAPPPRVRGDADGAVEIELRDDMPDELAGDTIDLGAVTAEFFALALDPYPRKPGVAFEVPADAGASDSPFARLAQLRPDEPESR